MKKKYKRIKLEPLILDELFDSVVKKHLMKCYKKKIRDNYYIEYIQKVCLPGESDKWVVKLKRTLDSYNTFEEVNEKT